MAPPGTVFTGQAQQAETRLPRERSVWRRQTGNIAAIVIAILIFVAISTGGRSLHHGGYRLITIHGSSMGDTVPIGSVVLAQWLTPQDINIGDVILVEENVDGVKAPPKLHRIIRLDEKDGAVTVQTKGDGNAAPDPEPFVLSGNVLVYRHHLPHVGYWLSAIQTPIGWFAVIALPFTLAALTILISVWRTDRRPAAA